MTYSKWRSRYMGLLVGTLLLLSGGNVQAQSIEQLIEQVILDKQKLAELKTILKDMKDGYQVLDNGYRNIRDIVKGNFNLHKAFLDGLLSVSLPVHQYYKVASIIDKERSIVTEYQAAKRRWGASRLFTPGELNYFNRVYGALSARGGQCLDRLSMVITADELRMSDAERMQSVDRIYADVTEQLAQLRRFNDDVSIQCVQRAKEQINLQTLKSIYGNIP